MEAAGTAITFISDLRPPDPIHPLIKARKASVSTSNTPDLSSHGFLLPSNPALSQHSLRRD